MRKFAIIGCGRIAERHALQISRMANLVAVCDIDIEKAKLLSKTYKAAYFDDAKNMLLAFPEIEIVSICTPNYLHAEHSILALNNGKHVLCEKPLAIQVPDAQNMIEAAERNQKKLFVVKQNRYNPPVVALKSLLNDNKLGNINSFQINCFWNRPDEYYISTWKGKKELDGGTLFTQFSHFIDLLYWLLGDVKSVKANISNFQHAKIDIEDAGVVLFEMNSGAIGTMNYNVNAFKKNMEGSITLFGEKGTIKIGGQYLNTIEYQSIEEQHIDVNEMGNPANDYGFYQGSMSNHDKVYENLLKAIDDSDIQFASAYDGIKTVEIIEMIFEAASNYNS
jgi:UDP-N-acetyl-2-amino-2-deoxyglucuronate dehydrogenase